MSGLSDLPKLLRAGLRKHNVPGAALAVYRNGRVVHTVAGLLNLDTGVPVTEQSVFQIGSITKVFTATLIMQLVDEGLIDIDQPVQTYLRDFAVADVHVARHVTPRHLLSHTSGIEGDYFVDSGRGDDSIARLQAMGSMLPQLFDLGERMSYCNFGFAILGRIIEVVTGDSWDTAMQNRLFEPLGMTHALTRPEDAIRYRSAIGHIPPQRKTSRLTVTPTPWLAFGQKAAGSTPMMSVIDLMRFVGMHLNRGEVKPGIRLLSRSSTRAMQRRQVRLPKHAPLGLDSWGLGWMRFNWNGTRLIGHDGSTSGQNAFLRVLPEKDLAIGLLTNGGDATGLFEHTFQPLFANLGGIDMPDVVAADYNRAIDAKRLIGEYENITGVITVTHSAEGFALQIDHKPSPFPNPPTPPTPLRFVDRSTAFLASGDAAADRQTIIFNGPDLNHPSHLMLGLRQYRRRNPPCA